MTQYTPTLEQVRGMANQGNIVPVYREVAADLETPVSAYLKVARGRYSFLLEASPIPFTGAVGAPVNPVAIK